MKSAHIIAAVTVLLAGVAIAVLTGRQSPRPPETPKPPAPVGGTSPPPPVEPAPDARALAEEAAKAAEMGEIDRALGLYDRSLALREDRDVAAARERVKAAIAERQKGFEAAAREEERKGLVAEAARLERAGKLEEAKGKYEESLRIGDDPFAWEGIARIGRAIEERDRAARAAEVEKQFERLVAEARGLTADGRFEEAIAKYDEALRVRDDAGLRAARDEAKRLSKMASFRAKWGFAPRADELEEEDWDEIAAAAEPFLAAWADRAEPSKGLDERAKAAEAADAALKALPDKLENHPAFQFLNGGLHFLVAMGIYDDFLAKRRTLRSLDEQEKLQKETFPTYNEELAIANRRLKAARDRTDGHFATCFLEALSRAWRSDARVSQAGRESLAEVFETIEPLTPFDDELRLWHAERGIFRER